MGKLVTKILGNPRPRRDFIGEARDASTSKRAEWAATQALVTYILPLNDVAVTAVETFCTSYVGSTEYKDNETFRTLLDSLQEQATQRYAKICATTTEKQKFADYLDGVLAYLSPEINELYNALYDMYNEYTPTYDCEMLATISSVQCIVHTALINSSSALEGIERVTSKRILNTDSYLMKKELDTITSLLDSYGRLLDSDNIKALDTALARFIGACQPTPLIKAGCAYASRYQDVSAIKRDTKIIFGITWET